MENVVDALPTKYDDDLRSVEVQKRGILVNKIDGYSRTYIRDLRDILRFLKTLHENGWVVTEGNNCVIYWNTNTAVESTYAGNSIAVQYPGFSVTLKLTQGEMDNHRRWKVGVEVERGG